MSMMCHIAHCMIKDIKGLDVLDVQCQDMPERNWRNIQNINKHISEHLRGCVSREISGTRMTGKQEKKFFNGGLMEEKHEQGIFNRQINKRD